MQLQKKGIRVLGISESYSSREWSLLCGVVMRRDLHIDGFCFGKIHVGGVDATSEIIKMIQNLNREDINAIFLNGCVIAWFNIIDPQKITKDTGIPVVCVSYEESPGLTDHIIHHFPKDHSRLEAYEKLKARMQISLPTGLSLYARGYGCTDAEVIRICRIFTHHGKIPEPLRVARLCARSAMLYNGAEKKGGSP